MKRLLTVLIAVAGFLTTSASALLFTGPAHADTLTGTITVQALINQATGALPVPGVQFTLSRIDGLDPLTAAGRKTLADYQRDPSKTRSLLVDTIAFPSTDDLGKTKLTDLPIGAYLIHEQSRPLSTGPDEKVRDFVVAVPTTTQDGLAHYTLEITPKPESGVSPPTTPATPTSSAAGPGDSQCPQPDGAARTNSSAAADVCPSPSAQAAGPRETSTVINAGGGSDFDSAKQLIRVAIGAGLLLLAVVLTRRRNRKDEQQG